MPSHFIVATHNETPKLYVAQTDLPQILTDLRQWASTYNLTGYVFAPRKVAGWADQLVSTPLNHAELTLVGIERPDSYLDQCMWSWGNELDHVPYEQQLETIQRMKDYTDRKSQQIEQRHVREEEQNASVDDKDKK